MLTCKHNHKFLFECKYFNKKLPVKNIKRRNKNMKIFKVLFVGVAISILFNCSKTAQPEFLPSEFLLTKDLLLDKIKGGWAGQTIGCTFGGPTEFRYRGTIIPDYQPIPWNQDRMSWQFEHGPGLYDDIYMDLTFVAVFEKEGLDAPAISHAQAFANAEYSLWHANQEARYNILNGILPPESGFWLNNAHAEDIDFQIEADFAGLMSPGMINTSSEICDKIGHIMNYGDGWYGGVYVAALYSLAFVTDDILFLAEEALKVIPKNSQYYQCQKDVINWYKENPEDWKGTWFKVMEKWGEDVGCPNGVFNPFNIDAKINSAWILLGLLYGKKDFGKTISISTRCGDDSDCNPASSGGILGTILGYQNIPEYWKQGLGGVESKKFKYTEISLNDVYQMSFKHALQLVTKNGGKVDGETVTIKVQTPQTVPLEVGFSGHFPLERRSLGLQFSKKATFEFEGIGFSTTGGVQNKGAGEYTFEVELILDGKFDGLVKLPTNFRNRSVTPFKKFQLPFGKHTVELNVLNPTESAEINIQDLIVYGDKPLNPKY
jgi:hypothetical protein